MQLPLNGYGSSYVYGSDGLRHRSALTTAAGMTTTTDYALDGQSVVQELRTLSGVQTPIATYLTGPSGPMYKRQDGQGTIRWYVYDGLGSVVGEVDPNGVMTARRGFDVYGATRSSSGTATSKHGFVGGLGHPTEDETGLVYMRARYYDAGVGRFVSEDPSGNGLNWFLYADNSPSNKVDPDGKVPIGFLSVLLAQYGGNPILDETIRSLGKKIITMGFKEAAVEVTEVANLLKTGSLLQAAVAAGSMEEGTMEDTIVEGAGTAGRGRAAATALGSANALAVGLAMQGWAIELFAQSLDEQ